MATSENLDIGLVQALIKCGLCSSKVEMYCKTCQFDLCSGCVGKHMLEWSSRKHNIVKYSMMFITTSELLCPIHSNQSCYFQCRDCNVPACNKCVVTRSHIYHNVIEIEEPFKLKEDTEAKQAFLEQKIISKCNKIITQIKENISELPNVSKKLISEVSKTANERHGVISRKAAEQHQEVNKETDQRLSEIKDKENKDRAKLQKTLSEFQNCLSDIQGKIRKTKNPSGSRGNGASRLQCQTKGFGDLPRATEMSLEIHPDNENRLDLPYNNRSKSGNIYSKNDGIDYEQKREVFEHNRDINRGKTKRDSDENEFIRKVQDNVWDQKNKYQTKRREEFEYSRKLTNSRALGDIKKSTEALIHSGPSYPMASLYVGNLHPHVTEAMLFKKFSTAGPVHSIRVCRGVITRRSLEYAYVGFQQPADAETALKTMNFDTIKGWPIRILWSQHDPFLRKSGVSKVFIKNLDKCIDNTALYNSFSAFGNILCCKIVCDEFESNGYGFVHFETEEAARSAIEKVNGMLLNGKKVFVRRFMSRLEQFNKKRMFRNIYVKNLSEEIDDSNLRRMFEHYGKVISVKVMTDDSSGKGRGFGFVSFEDPEAAEKAVAAVNGKGFSGNLMYKGRAQTKIGWKAELTEKFERIRIQRINSYQKVNLFVKNLDDNIDDERLRREFAQFGTITSAKVMSKGNRSKGFGFVCFSSPEEATKAVTEMNGRIVVAKPLIVEFAKSKEELKASQYMQHINSMRMQGQQMGQVSQIIQPGGAGNFVPTMPQAQRFYAPNNMPTMNTNPRWQTTKVKPTGQPTSGAPQIRQQRLRSKTIVYTGVNVLPIFDQSSTPNIQQCMPVNQQVPGRPLGEQLRVSAVANRLAGYTGYSAGHMMKQHQGQNPGKQQEQDRLTAIILAKNPPQEQKQILGERLFPLISNMVPDMAGKITGMLLEIDNSELLHMLESQESLEDKVKEAKALFQAHQAKDG